MGNTEVSTRELELHVPDWNNAVVALRTQLGISPGSQKDVERQLQAFDRDNVADLVRASFFSAQRQGIPGRYLEYFAACAVSHFDETSADHRLPAWLSVRLYMLRLKENPLPPGTMRIEFYYRHRVDSELRSGTLTPEHPIIDVFKEAFIHIAAESRSFRWKLAELPYNFEVLWPYDVPMIASEDDLKQIKDDLRLNGLNMYWHKMQRFIAYFRGKWVMLPLRGGSVSQPITIQRFFGLDDGVPIVALNIPIAILPGVSAAAYRIQLDDEEQNPFKFRHLGEIRPFQPLVVADPAVPNEEMSFIKAWQEMIRFLTVHKALRKGPGKPKEKMLVPGLKLYSRLLEGDYRRRLMDWGNNCRNEKRPYPKPTPKELQRLWNSAKREVKNYVKQEERDMVGDDLLAIKEKVEEEKPWEPN